MNTYHVQVDANPAPEDGQCLEDELYAYDVEQTGCDDGKLLTMWVKNNADKIIA